MEEDIEAEVDAIEVLVAGGKCPVCLEGVLLSEVARRLNNTQQRGRCRKCEALFYVRGGKLLFDCFKV